MKIQDQEFRDPLVLEDDSGSLILKVFVKNKNGYECELIMPLQKFENLNAYNAHAGQYDAAFAGSASELKKLRLKLTGEAGMLVKGTRLIGRLEESFIDFGNRRLLEDDTHPLKGKFDANQNRGVESFVNFMDKLPPKSWEIFGWFAAAPFCEEIRQKYELFPILIVSGEQGSGKTDLVEMFAQMFCWIGDLESWGRSLYVLTRLLSCTNSVPICFDEYSGRDFEKLDVLKLVAKGAKWTKGDWHNGPSQVQMDLVAPVCILGENSVENPALLERGHAIELKKSDRVEMHKWAAALFHSNNIRFGNYVKWAAAQTIPRPKPAEKPGREKMGEWTVNFGLSMFSKWMKIHGVDIAVPKIEKGEKHIEYADDGVVFVRLLHTMFENGEFERTSCLVENEDGALKFNLRSVWPLVKEKSFRLGIEIKSEKDLRRILENKKYIEYTTQVWYKKSRRQTSGYITKEIWNEIVEKTNKYRYVSME